jgi:TfoX/Sxy family transcriptional regulator of competence genes
LRFKTPPRLIPDLDERCYKRGLQQVEVAREARVSEQVMWLARKRGISLGAYNRINRVLMEHPVLAEDAAEENLAQKRERKSAKALAVRWGHDLDRDMG